jgi:hypothetical protein
MMTFIIAGTALLLAVAIGVVLDHPKPSPEGTRDYEKTVWIAGPQTAQSHPNGVVRMF